MSRRAPVDYLPPLLLFVVAVAVRLGEHHAALLYPDGYQYLLMARGISEHLQPTTVLGPGGETFTPNADAALKPLFPLLVAAVHALGLSWLEAARIVTVTAGAVAVTALALVVTKLSGSRLAGLAAGALLLAAPSVGFWSGFSGPDPVAEALVLVATLAFVHHRPRVGGILTGLAIATRPEIAVVALAAGLVSLRSPTARRELARAAPAAVVTAALVFALLRTPIAVQDWRLVWLSPLLFGPVLFFALMPRSVVRFAASAAAVVVAFALVTEAGPRGIWHSDWPLLLLGGASVAILLRDERGTTLAAMCLGIVLVLGAVYVLKNPALDRYFSLLMPVAALLAGLAAGSLPAAARPPAFAAIALVALAGFMRPVPGSRDYDVFATVARQVRPTLDAYAGPLLTAAPDAYGFWLPDHAVRRIEPGACGAVLLDAAQRSYEPKVAASGTVLTRVTDEIAFTRTNGEIDAYPAVLVDGQVVPRAYRESPCRDCPSTPSGRDRKSPPHGRGRRRPGLLPRAEPACEP